MNNLSDIPSRVAQGASRASAAVGGTPLSHQVGTKAHGVVDRLSDGAHHMVDSLESAAETMEPKGRRWLSSTQGYVRAHPFRSLGIAMVAGALVRHLVRR